MKRNLITFIVISILLSLTLCFSYSKDFIKGDCLATWLDTNLRDKPGHGISGYETRSLQVIKKGEIVEFLGEKSDIKKESILEGKHYNSNWLKVKTTGGLIGWIYGGALVACENDNLINTKSESAVYKTLNEYITLSINKDWDNAQKYWSSNMLRYMDGDECFIYIIDNYKISKIVKINTNLYNYKIKFHVIYYFKEEYVNKKYQPKLTKLDENKEEEIQMIQVKGYWKVKMTYPFNRYLNIEGATLFLKDYTDQKKEYIEMYKKIKSLKK